jgi:hypothetical protein
MKPIESELLTALLGQLDALFEPVNFAWEGTPAQYQAQWQRRHKYLGWYDWPDPGLLPWGNPGQDMAEKKRYYRAMNALEGQGLIRINGHAVGLTAEGLAAARKLCGHIQLEDCLPGLDVMLAFTGTDHEWIAGEGEEGFLSEASLAGFKPWPPGTIGKTRLPDSALWVIDALIPLAIASLVDHDFKPDFELPLYRLTDEGRKLAKERQHAGKADPAAWPKLKNKANRHTEPDAYLNAYESARSTLESAKPLQANRVKHPLGDIWPREMLNPPAAKKTKDERRRNTTSPRLTTNNKPKGK